MLARVVETIQRYGMWERGQRVGVAVSGGADSVCLLHVLLELARQWDLRLVVLHLNHRLRGAESDGDEQFVRELAARLRLPVTVRSEDVGAIGDNLEQAAREARLAFFRDQIASGAVDRVATGHTRNDQAETVLYRLLRGAGGAGLSAIRPVSSGVIRPLLDVSRDEVEQYLTERSIAWREDSSNGSPQFARNRIRRQLLPQLAAEWNPSIGGTLARLADWSLAEEEYWDAEIARVSAGHLEERDGAVLLPVDWLCGLPLAVARRVVRRSMLLAKGDLRSVGFDHIAAVIRLGGLESGHGRVHVPGLDVVRSFNWVRLVLKSPNRASSRQYSVAAPVPSSVQIPGGKTVISLELVEKSETIALRDSVYNGETDCVDWRTVSGPLEVRSWRPGDRYQPKGSTAEEKIKTLFQKARIPVWERSRWPVLTDGSDIVWARRFGPALRFAAETSSAVVLRIREVQAP